MNNLPLVYLKFKIIILTKLFLHSHKPYILRILSKNSKKYYKMTYKSRQVAQYISLNRALCKIIKSEFLHIISFGRYTKLSICNREDITRGEQNGMIASRLIRIKYRKILDIHIDTVRMYDKVYPESLTISHLIPLARYTHNFPTPLLEK